MLDFAKTSRSSTCKERAVLAASIEVSPTHVLKKPELLEHIPPATRTYIVDLGTHEAHEWAEMARRLVRAGLEPVPHIAARRLTSAQQLDERLAALTGEAGVRDALLIAGGADAPVGPFTSSLDVLDTGLLDRHGIERLAVAGHPEGSPDISDRVIMEALAAKQAYRDRTGADVRIATQFGFNMGAALNWAQRLEEAGVDMPVHLGIAGPASVTSLIKYAAMCGVKASTAFLAKKSGVVTSLMTNHSPEPYIQPVEEHVAAHPTSLIKQFHVFPFGGIAKAADWLCGRGSWNADARAAFAAMSDSARQTIRNTSGGA